MRAASRVPHHCIPVARIFRAFGCHEMNVYTIIYMSNAVAVGRIEVPSGRSSLHLGATAGQTGAAGGHAPRQTSDVVL